MIGVSKSAYYRQPVQATVTENEIEKEVIRCYKQNQGRYGRIRIRKALFNQGYSVSESKIARILAKNGLQAKSGRTGKSKRPKPTEKQYIEENLIKDKFAIILPNFLWCSDISELCYHGGKLYICGVIDVATRRIVGWAIAKNQTQQIVQDAFEMAIGRNPSRPTDAVFHSDRGCQYTAKRTKDMIECAGFRKSMSRPGTPSDNQPIESFWHTLEVEMPDIRHLNFESTKRAIVDYIEMYYNSNRLHSGIDYKTPNQFFTLCCVH